MAEMVSLYMGSPLLTPFPIWQLCRPEQQESSKNSQHLSSELVRSVQGRPDGLPGRMVY